MSWAARFRARQYLKGSLWLVPLVAAVLGPLLAAVASRLEGSLTLPADWEYSPGTASTLLTAIVGAMIGLTGFVVTLGVLIVQMATGTLSPRFMRLWYRDPLQKAVLGVFVGTLTYSFALLSHIESDDVPSLGVTIAGLAVAVSIVLFLLYLDRFIHRLRPVEVAALVGRVGARVFATLPAEPAGAAYVRPPSASIAEVRTTRAGAIQAIDHRGLLAAALRHGCVVAVRYEVGDFVPRGATVLELIAPRTPPSEHRLRDMIALGDERTIEQDPAFALRIMVDIALMALSPAVNAPTTAVQVLDHVEELLQRIGERPLAPDRALRDARGDVRVLLRARTWGEYLQLGVAEIRHYGAHAPQVTRRLRATLESLHDHVRPEHRAAVQAQLDELEVALDRSALDPLAREFATAPDRQGIGGVAPTGHFTPSG